MLHERLAIVSLVGLDGFRRNSVEVAVEDGGAFMRKRRVAEAHLTPLHCA